MLFTFHVSFIGKYHTVNMNRSPKTGTLHIIHGQKRKIKYFRFIESNFKFMIVDIQGVQDIYTDPQIHTIDGKGYGEGNLGIRGIALFFLSHR